jgi:hypothetical protein
MKKALFVAASVCMMSSVAFAKTPPKQTHHCMKDGAEVKATKKQCIKQGGKWEKMDDAAAGAAGSTTPPAGGDVAPPTPPPAGGDKPATP